MNLSIHYVQTKSNESTKVRYRSFCSYIEEAQIYCRLVYLIIVRIILKRPVQYINIDYSVGNNMYSFPLFSVFFMHLYIYNARTRTRTNERLFFCNLKEILYEITNYSMFSYKT